MEALTPNETDIVVDAITNVLSDDKIINAYNSFQNIF